MNITSKQYALTWYELLQDKKNNKNVSKKMLMHLYKTGQLSKLAEILRNLEEIEYIDQGIEHVTITGAREMTNTQAKKIIQKILKTNEVSVSHKINPELIGGIQVETKNKRWDLSVKSQLLLLSKQIT